MTLRQARARRAALLDRSVDPVAERVAQQRLAAEHEHATAADAYTLRSLGARWMAARAERAHWVLSTVAGVQARLETHVYPKLGDLPVSEISMDQVEVMLTKLHRKFPRLAVAVQQHLHGIFQYALRRQSVTGLKFNPVQLVAPDLPSRANDGKHRAYVTTIEDARAVLRAVEARASALSPWTLLAHRLIALTGVRMQEALGARWEEFDLDAGIWTIPAERMKGKHGARRIHRVMLAPQAVEVIRAARRIRERHSAKADYVFPCERQSGNPTIDRSTMTKTIRRSLERAGIGRVLVAHGWRSTFSTIMNELDPTAYRVIDTMLAHKAFDHVEAHYNHATYLAARRALACRWADLLLDGAPTASALIGLDAIDNVLPFPTRGVA